MGLLDITVQRSASHRSVHFDEVAAAGSCSAFHYVSQRTASGLGLAAVGW
jgi:hypothetical protein